MQRCSVGLKKGNEVSLFVWQDRQTWRFNLRQGAMKGGWKGKKDHKIRVADLKYGTLPLRHLRTAYDERMTRTSIVGVRMEYPLLNAHT